MNEMKRLVAVYAVAAFVAASSAHAGTVQLIDKGASGANGTVEVKANVPKKVSLSISDTGANDLVSSGGIDFGSVDADGTPGVLPGISLGDRAQYVGEFIFSATRSGIGNVTLTVERSVAGTFNATDGVVIEDDAGVLQSLDGGGTPVSVINDQAEGDFTKKLGITVHEDDLGALNSTLRFTLSAL